jgi:hypothetical protein
MLARSEINTMMPATVIAWRPPIGAPPLRTPALVDVLPDFMYRRRINVPADAVPPEIPIQRANGWEAVGPYPMITSVPVAYPGSDGMRVSGPIFPGARGWLFFAQRSIDDWINTGGPVDPAFDYQWHNLSDAIFVPGARFGAVAEDINPLLHTIGSADGGAGIEISEAPIPARTIAMRTQGPTATVDATTQVKLGEAAVLGVARLTDTTSADTTMAIFIAAVAAQSAVLGGLGFGVAAPAPSDFGIVTQASSKVVSE